jgi:hypothetical protein
VSSGVWGGVRLGQQLGVRVCVFGVRVLGAGCDAATFVWVALGRACLCPLCSLSSRFAQPNFPAPARPFIYPDIGLFLDCKLAAAALAFF